jgi:hypothetical protein
VHPNEREVPELKPVDSVPVHFTAEVVH